MVGTTSRVPAHRTCCAVIGLRTPAAGFFDEACKEFYLRRLLQCQGAYQLRLHAYLLMETGVLIMATPLTPSGLRAFIRFLAASYDSYYSIRFERQLQVWQRTASICQLPNDRLVRDCQKFIERFMLRDDSSQHPGAYHYSSYCANAFSVRPRFLQRHRAVSEFLRQEPGMLQRYREFIATPFRVEYERFLRSRLLRGHPLIGKRVGVRPEDGRLLTDNGKSGTMNRASSMHGIGSQICRVDR